MKSIIAKSLYAGLGLLGTGKETVEQLGRKVARSVNISEKDGERIARQLRSKSKHALGNLQKTLDTEVNKVAHALHIAIHPDVEAAKKSKTSSKTKGKKKATHARSKTKSATKTHAKT